VITIGSPSAGAQSNAMVLGAFVPVAIFGILIVVCVKYMSWALPSTRQLYLGGAMDVAVCLSIRWF
jgi:branched-subunit amino acid transport protein AzlD